MPALVQIGLIEITVGVLSGWVLVLAQERPQALQSLGITAPRSLQQAHLAALLMGAIVTTAGLAAQPISGWIIITIAIGALADPFLFVALACGVDRRTSHIYRTAATTVFGILSIGFVALLTTATA